MMHRRAFVLGLGGMAVPFSSHAQKPAVRIFRIGYLTARAIELEKRWLNAFLQGLRELGYVEGKNVILEQRHAHGQPEKLPELAAELVRMKVDVLVAAGAAPAVEAKKATRSIPIVTLTQDPVGLGLIDSLARPGGNVTGVSDYHSAMGSKRLEMLKEVVPAASRIAVFHNSGLSPNVTELKELQAAATTLRVSLQPIDIKLPQDVDRAFAQIVNECITALLLLPSSEVSSQMKQIAGLALKHRIAAMYTVALWAELGGLLSYGTDFYAYYRRAATYVDKILKGAKPADLPIEEPTRFELVVNMKTAKALGITFPQSILIRADRAIE